VLKINYCSFFFLSSPSVTKTSSRGRVGGELEREREHGNEGMRETERERELGNGGNRDGEGNGNRGIGEL
jgi:hypothetical protein